MAAPIPSPSIKATAFACPHCGAPLSMLETIVTLRPRFQWRARHAGGDGAADLR
jgi:hypothetical protein